jgi:hypothetical protein
MMTDIKVQKTVRIAMNELMGIAHDKEVVGMPPPPQDDLDLYEDDGGGPGPSISPMIPHWGKLKSDWNYQLFEIFLARLKAPGPDGWELVFNDETEAEVQEMFFERLYRLKREIKAATPKQGEKNYQARERVARKKMEVLDRQRPNTRRKQVSEFMASCMAWRDH